MLDNHVLRLRLSQSSGGQAIRGSVHVVSKYVYIQYRLQLFI